MDKPRTPPDATGPRAADRLDSWKKIATYLGRDVTTVQRWERREGMPVHRHLHDKQGSVFAFRSELDEWRSGRRPGVAGEEEAAAEGAPRRAVRVRTLGWGALAAGTAVLAALGASWLAGRAPPWRDPLADARVVRLLPEFDGIGGSAALSRDGRQVAFQARSGGVLDVWVADVASGAARNLTHGQLQELANPSIRTLGFSPDGAQVEVWGRSAEGARPEDVSVYAVPAGGGELGTLLAGAAEVQWSADGRRLAYHTTAPGDPIFVRDARGGVARRIYAASPGTHCHFPLWSPDGAYLYFVQGTPPARWDVWRIHPDGTGLEQVTHQGVRISYPVLLDPHTLLYLATDADGEGPWIYGMDPETRLARRLSLGLERYSSLSASADGRRLVATLASVRSSLWRLTLGAAGTHAAPELLIANATRPRFAGGALLYVSARGLGPALWTQRDGPARSLWHGPPAGVIGAPAASPDGRQIALVASEDGRRRLLVMDADGGHVRALGGPLEPSGDPAWMPDGSALLVAAQEQGEPRLTRVPLDGAAPVPFVGEYSLDPRWSPDGRFVLYSGADVGTTFPVRAAAADGRVYSLPALQLTRGARQLAFAGAGRLVFLRGSIGHKDLWQLDLASGRESLLAELPADFVVRDFDVSPDGAAAILEREEQHASLALIERAR